MSQAPLRKQSRWSLWIPLGKSPDSHGTRCRRPRVADITWFYRRFYRIWTMYMSLSLSHCTSIYYIYIYYVYIYIYVCVCDLVFLIYLFMIFFWYLSTSPHRTGKKNDRWLNHWISAVAPWRFGCAISGVTNGTMAVVDGLVLGKSSPETHGVFTMKWIGFSGYFFPIIQVYDVRISRL